LIGHPPKHNLWAGLRALRGVLGAGILLAVPAPAQEHSSSPSKKDDRWSVHAQATVVAQTHGPFRSPYLGLNSLQSRRESRGSLTTTLFLGLKLKRGTELYANPEVAGGKGLSGVLGLADFPNGEITRVSTPTPKPYLGRVFIRQTWGLGGGSEFVEAGPNQLGGSQPVSRLTLTLGKISVTDLFDTNTYSHDPRTQFLNWALMDNGAWDYPADARGYTWGLALELTQHRWSFRVGSFMEPVRANQMALDGHLRRNHGEVAELELRHAVSGRAGKVKFLAYVNHANMGSYRLALSKRPVNPDITQTRRPDTVKYGLGLNLEQALTSDVGAFLRLGWNDGKTETWAFTEIDRTAHLGLQAQGRAWRRPQDVVGLAAVRSGLAPDHRDYLAAGGYGFLVGDGRLNPGSERLLEAYYAFKVVRTFTLTPNYQFFINPAYNRDRGQVSVWALRLHWEM